jgi:hypothetical protein
MNQKKILRKKNSIQHKEIKMHAPPLNILKQKLKFEFLKLKVAKKNEKNKK